MMQSLGLDKSAYANPNSTTVFKSYNEAVHFYNCVLIIIVLMVILYYLNSHTTSSSSCNRGLSFFSANLDRVKKKIPNYGAEF